MLAYLEYIWLILWRQFLWLVLPMKVVSMSPTTRVKSATPGISRGCSSDPRLAIKAFSYRSTCIFCKGFFRGCGSISGSRREKLKNNNRKNGSKLETIVFFILNYDQLHVFLLLSNFFLFQQTFHKVILLSIF